ncbi:hypothetical protein D3C71_1780620 [compost metagenome]
MLRELLTRVAIRKLVLDAVVRWLHGELWQYRCLAHGPDLRMQRRMLLPGAGSAMLDAALAPLRVAAPADDHDLLLGGDV